MNSIIVEGYEAVLIDRIPETQLSRNPAAKPIKNGKAIGALGCSGETE